jgi:hypothetical protein
VVSEHPKARGRRAGIDILVIAAAAGLAIAIFNDVWSGNGIHGTAGALLVVISSALMLASASVLGFARQFSRGLRGILLVLIGLDVLGTGLAAYMLEATWLIGAMGVALIGWILHLVSDRALSPSQGSSMIQRGVE